LKTVKLSNLLNLSVLICHASCTLVLVGKINKVENVFYVCATKIRFSRYRGVVLEVIDKVTAKVVLVDVGSFSVVRSVKEIFSMPSKYKGKSLVSKSMPHMLIIFIILKDFAQTIIV